MSTARLQLLRGRQVSLALRDGTRIDDCRLVSTGRSLTSTIWLVSNGADVFVRRDEVLAVWSASGSPLAA